MDIQMTSKQIKNNSVEIKLKITFCAETNYIRTNFNLSNTLYVQKAREIQIYICISIILFLSFVKAEL